jgi:hypothetical protein
MTDTHPDNADPIAVEPSPAPRLVATTKRAAVTRMLSRNRGATLAEIMAATSWQPHSTRAFLSGLRREGKLLLKEARKSGETAYRLEA